jgi:hypothetical protein
VPELTKGALPPVGFEYTFSERTLMQAHSYCSGGIPPTQIVWNGIGDVWPLGFGEAKMLSIVYSYGESQLVRLVTDNKDWPRCEVLPRYETMEVDQR